MSFVCAASNLGFTGRLLLSAATSRFVPLVVSWSAGRLVGWSAGRLACAGGGKRASWTAVQPVLDEPIVVYLDHQAHGAWQPGDR